MFSWGNFFSLLAFQTLCFLMIFHCICLILFEYMYSMCQIMSSIRGMNRLAFKKNFFRVENLMKGCALITDHSSFKTISVTL